MGLHNFLLSKVNRPIDGGPIAGRVFPTIGSVRTDVDATGRRFVKLYDAEYWLPVEHEANEDSLVWTSPENRRAIFQYDDQQSMSVYMSNPIGDHGYQDDSIQPIGAYAEGSATVVSTPMSCMEYAASEDPEDVVRVHCIERKDNGENDAVLRLALEHHHPEILERELKARLGDEAIEIIDAFVEDVIDSIPDTVYHKCSVKTLLSTLKSGKYQKVDDTPRCSDVVKTRNMSTSDVHMPSVRLKTPWTNQKVTIKMRIPKNVCPLRMVYDLPINYRHTNWYSDEHRMYNNAEDALVDTYYSVRMKSALRKRYPACRRVGEDDIERKGKFDGYEYEREIFFIPDDGESILIRPEDVVEIIAEGECQTSADFVRAVLEEVGLDEFVPKVRDSEFCAITYETLGLERQEDRKAWDAEPRPWRWNNRLGHLYESGERRPEKIGKSSRPS